MGVVSRADHNCGSYGFEWKSLKRWRNTCFWSIEVAVVNRFILFNEHCNYNGMKTVRHLWFRKALIQQVVGDVWNRQWKSAFKSWQRRNAEQVPLCLTVSRQKILCCLKQQKSSGREKSLLLYNVLKKTWYSPDRMLWKVPHLEFIQELLLNFTQSLLIPLKLQCSLNRMKLLTTATSINQKNVFIHHFNGLHSNPQLPQLWSILSLIFAVTSHSNWIVHNSEQYRCPLSSTYLVSMYTYIYIYFFVDYCGFWGKF